VTSHKQIFLKKGQILFIEIQTFSIAPVTFLIAPVMFLVAPLTFLIVQKTFVLHFHTNLSRALQGFDKDGQAARKNVLGQFWQCWRDFLFNQGFWDDFIWEKFVCSWSIATPAVIVLTYGMVSWFIGCIGGDGGNWECLQRKSNKPLWLEDSGTEVLSQSWSTPSLKTSICNKTKMFINMDATNEEQIFHLL
jgi:hypothetical protein